MEFTFQYTVYLINGLQFAAPLLIWLALQIVALGLLVGSRESWGKFDAIYWSFVTATTVGYGDFRPLKRLSKIFSIIIALTGMIFTGIMVALAINAASIAFNDLNEGKNPRAFIIEKSR